MKKIFLMMAAAVLVCSCNKSNLDVAEEPLQESVLYVNLSEGEETRAAGAGHGVQNDDNHVQTLELFVFRINPGASDDGILDGYRKFTAAELGNLSNPFLSNSVWFIRLFFGRIAFTGNIVESTGVTCTSIHACLKISQANSYQLQYPWLVA